ncbi:MAG: class I SAM-dependent methyltransferase [Clostridia bacterium]|nr:class I SAM-dependent methyltransferase [Clostridia bacterium]
MLTKTEAMGYSIASKDGLRLTPGMKACASWAAMEEHDKILDMACGSGALLNHLNEKLRLTLCGMCDSADQARAISEQLGGADVIAARMEDIPWRDDTFNVVMLSSAMRGDVRRVLDEALRVLRAGGQFVLASPLFFLRGENEFSRKELMRMMQEAGFRDVSFRTSGLFGAIVGWKAGLIDQK